MLKIADFGLARLYGAPPRPMTPKVILSNIRKDWLHGTFEKKDIELYPSSLLQYSECPKRQLDVSVFYDLSNLSASVPLIHVSIFILPLSISFRMGCEADSRLHCSFLSHLTIPWVNLCRQYKASAVVLFFILPSHSSWGGSV